MRCESAIFKSAGLDNWLIWPEDRTLIAHQLDGDHYRVIATISAPSQARIAPFDTVALDLAYILGD